jgi:hypothetical protein
MKGRSSHGNGDGFTMRPSGVGHSMISEVRHEEGLQKMCTGHVDTPTPAPTLHPRPPTPFTCTPLARL